jgi:hypothetical protein
MQFGLEDLQKTPKEEALPPEFIDNRRQGVTAGDIGKWKQRETNRGGIYHPATLKSLPDKPQGFQIWAYLSLYPSNPEDSLEPQSDEVVPPLEAPEDPDEALLEQKRIRPSQRAGKARAKAATVTKSLPNRVDSRAARVTDEFNGFDTLRDLRPFIGGEPPPIDLDSIQIRRVKADRPSNDAPIPEDEDIVFRFLANPEKLEFSGLGASYASVKPHLAKAPYLQFQNTEAEVLDVKDVMLETWCEGKTIKPLIDGLRKLVEANTGEGEFEPPTLSFVWGERRFEPCKLMSVNWSENKWLSGNPAGARLSLKLVRIPEPNRTPENPFDNPLNDDPSEGLDNSSPGLRTDVLELTDRQLEDAREGAQQTLLDNLSLYSDEVQEIIRGERFSLIPSTDGVVRMFAGEAKEEIGVVGQWIGETGEMNTEGVSTLPSNEVVDDEED